MSEDVQELQAEIARLKSRHREEVLTYQRTQDSLDKELKVLRFDNRSLIRENRLLRAARGTKYETG